MSITVARRLPRFRRVSDQVSPIQITSRDLEIIRQISRHRFLRSTHVIALAGGSAQQVLRRLQRLYHLGYLERPKCQIDYYHRTGSQRLVYGLARKGATVLASLGGSEHRPIDWNEKNQHIGRPFLEHALLVSDFTVLLELSCRSRNDVRFITANELPLPSATQKLGEPFRWGVTMPTGEKLGIVPDAVFALDQTRAGGTIERTFYFLEADRATMPITRRGLKQTSFFRKLLAYEATWSHGLHRSRFGFHRFRVLTITSTSQRSTNLIAASRKLRSGQGLFMFSDAAALSSAANALAMSWRTAINQTETLLR
ncbi:MAG: replication-relaxation family protein [Verrucomicrobiaceae bacterium]|nr:replication-relaxation family protein [Verrucomicrobiaceae bacterium]